MATFCSRVPIECGWSLPCNHIAFFSSSSTQSCLPHYLSGVPIHTPPSWTSLSPCLFPRDADLWQTAAAFEVSHNPQVPDTLSLLPEFSLITWHPLFSLLCSFLFLSSNFNVIVVWNHILDRLCLHSLLGDISAVAPLPQIAHRTTLSNSVEGNSILPDSQAQTLKSSLTPSLFIRSSIWSNKNSCGLHHQITSSSSLLLTFSYPILSPLLRDTTPSPPDSLNSILTTLPVVSTYNCFFFNRTIRVILSKHESDRVIYLLKTL